MGVCDTIASSKGNTYFHADTFSTEVKVLTTVRQERFVNMFAECGMELASNRMEYMRQLGQFETQVTEQIPVAQTYGEITAKDLCST